MYEVDKDGERHIQITLHGLTFQYIFDLIKAQHWHSSIKNGVVHSCPHTESLHDHLVSCANICQTLNPAIDQAQAQSPKPDNQLFHLKMYIAGLMHDIGKPGTLHFTNKHLSFKGHGITGGALIRSLWSNAIQTEFGLSEHDWCDIATCADVHMCGYGFDSTDLQTDTFSLLSDSVREMLTCLRIGDSLSKIPPNHKVMENHETFVSKMEKKTTLVDFCTKYELNNGVLIQVQGSSASGKSRMARKIFKYLEVIGVPSNIIHIVNRDQATVYCSRRIQGIQTNQADFTDCSFSPEEYRQCLKHYHDSNKSYSHVINQTMKSAILDRLESGEIVIVDTLATKYYYSSHEIIPTCSSNSFKLSIWCCRPAEISEEESMNRLGMSLDEQLKISGTRRLMAPLGEHEHWEDVMSMGESGGRVDNQARPHISLSNSWSTTNIELLNFLDQLPALYLYHTTIPRTLNLANTRSMGMCQLLSILYNREKTADKAAEQICMYFNKYLYRVSKPMRGTKLENHVFMIKYMEHNKEFHSWSRNEARGQCYYVDFHTAFPLKYSLQRGIEVLAKFHSDDSIRETENIGGLAGIDVSKLQASQIHVVDALSKDNSELDAVLTAKADGSLILVTVYPLGSCEYEIVSRCIQCIGETNVFYTRTSNALIVVATQGTLFISPDMQDYFLTSIFSVFNKKPNSAVTEHANWLEISAIFGEWVLKQINVISIGNVTSDLSHIMCTLSYEAICKDRLTYKGVVHSELAVSYDRSQFVFLGLFHANDHTIRFVPHFELETKDLCEHPPIVRVSNSNEVFTIMKDLSNVVIGTLSATDFSTRYFSTPNTQFNPEGFVLLTRYDGVWDYSKIKSTMYYKLHKIRNEEIPTLLSYSDKCTLSIIRYFPLLASLKISRTKSRAEAIDFVSRVYSAIQTLIEPSCPLFDKFSVKARVRVDQFFRDYARGREYDANDSNNVKNVDSFWKMVVNTCNLVSIYTESKNAFSCSDKMDGSDIESLGKNLLMSAKPWLSDWETRINNCPIEGEPMATLISIYM